MADRVRPPAALTARAHGRQVSAVTLPLMSGAPPFGPQSAVTLANWQDPPSVGRFSTSAS